MLRFILVLGCACSALAQPAELEAKVKALAAKGPGRVTLFAKNLDTGTTLAISPDEKVRTASTIKLPVMAALFRLVDEGKASWTELLTLRAEDKVSGSGVLHELSPNVKLPLKDVMHLMIVVSDNTATNLILDRITADAVNAEMDRYGLKATRSMRKVRGDGNQLKDPSGFSKAGLIEENKRYGLGSSTPREMVMLLEKLERGEIVSAAASKEMIATLKRQQHKVIGRRMGESAVVASKSGSLDALRSDVGIVYTQRGRIAMAITIDGLPGPDYSADNPGEILIAELAKLLVRL